MTAIRLCALAAVASLAAGCAATDSALETEEPVASVSEVETAACPCRRALMDDIGRQFGAVSESQLVDRASQALRLSDDELREALEESDPAHDLAARYAEAVFSGNARSVSLVALRERLRQEPAFEADDRNLQDLALGVVRDEARNSWEACMGAWLTDLAIEHGRSFEDASPFVLELNEAGTEAYSVTLAPARHVDPKTSIRVRSVEFINCVEARADFGWGAIGQDVARKSLALLRLDPNRSAIVAITLESGDTMHRVIPPAGNGAVVTAASREQVERWGRAMRGTTNAERLDFLKGVFRFCDGVTLSSAQFITLVDGMEAKDKVEVVRAMLSYPAARARFAAERQALKVSLPLEPEDEEVILAGLAGERRELSLAYLRFDLDAMVENSPARPGAKFFLPSEEGNFRIRVPEDHDR